MEHMTTQRTERVPEVTLGWRMKLAIDGVMSRSEMADQLGVDPGTVSRWCADKGAPPKRAYLAQWAMATGVSLEWLLTGTAGDHGPDGGLGNTRRYLRNVA